MRKLPGRLNSHRGIAFVGNYLPRKCGIATFTHDLAEAVAQQAEPAQPVTVCAMNDTPEGYDYPERVRFEVRQEHPVDYSRAADFLNFSQINAVCLQHEYGIFGGEEGANILTLLRDLRWPLVVTCHTVMKDPRPGQREIFSEIAARARKLVVMSETAFGILKDVYDVNQTKIVHIPHGIHDAPFIDPSYYKDKFGVEGRKVLLTFGLLNRNKGIEHMIEALPAIVEQHPKITYVVLGATHPNVIRLEGESYRPELQRRVRDLGLEEHVLFHPRFVELHELLEYLGASDIFVTPYLNLDQITSGVLSYAMGTGKAVVSTPYWHAEELLAEGRGRLVPLGDSAALAREINALLDDEVALNAMRKKAYLHCRTMTWQTVSRAYLELFDEVRSNAPTAMPMATAVKRPISPTSVPAAKLDHVDRLSDDTGIAHHAHQAIPDWSYGYWLEDAAMALVAVAKHSEIFDSELSTRLTERFLALVQFMVDAQDAVIGRMDYSRRTVRKASEVELGKAIWALGYVVSRGPRRSGDSANETFNELVPSREIGDLRGAAYAVLGVSNYLIRFPGASAVRKYLSRHADKLRDGVSGSDWIARWPDQDWGIAAQALLIASLVLDSPDLAKVGIKLVGDLQQITSKGTVFLKRGDNPEQEELPASVMSFIEALGAAYHTEQDSAYLEMIRTAGDWFLGVNQRELSLYDFESNGCCDVVSASGLNQNQGAEATLSCLIAFLTLHELASGGMTKWPVQLNLPTVDT